ncbi:MAG: hypothetical protein Q8O04_12460 [Deltaproteobacteria bacterium]|nr:hypothetical protein [Deltaproteobacteria bacterium]
MNILRRYPKKFFWRAFYVSLVVSLILDFLWLYTHTFHYHFSFQNIPQFFAIFGIIGCMGLILIAKGMGYFIVTDEDYYDRQARR